MLFRSFSHRDGVLRVPIVGAADTVRVTVTYSGAPRDGLIIATDSAGRWTAFGDNWPNRARHWFPSVDHPSDKATVTWTVVAPANRKVIANGTLVAEETVAQPDDPDGHAGAPIALRRTRWREARPIPTYLMVIAAAPLVETPLGMRYVTALGGQAMRDLDAIDGEAAVRRLVAIVFAGMADPDWLEAHAGGRDPSAGSALARHGDIAERLRRMIGGDAAALDLIRRQLGYRSRPPAPAGALTVVSDRR